MNLMFCKFEFFILLDLVARCLMCIKIYTAPFRLRSIPFLIGYKQNVSFKTDGGLY